MDPAGDNQQLRDDFHELEHQMALLQNELSEAEKQLLDEKRNSEIVIMSSLLFLIFFVHSCSFSDTKNYLEAYSFL